MIHFVSRAAAGLVLLGVAAPLAAQQNPFKLPKASVPSIQVDYTYTGDMQGTGQRAMAGNRVMERQTTTGKFFGKSSTLETWTLTTPDSMYTADLTKKTGTQAPNVLPFMARAYDDLDKTSKQRLHQNMQDMVQMISRAFGTQTMWSDANGTTKTYAGEQCEEHTFGSFSVCNLQGAPSVPLHVQGSLLCVDFEQTATKVTKGEPAASAFQPPAGVTFQTDSNLANPDSMARGFVKYLASQELADSIAKAKTQSAGAAKSAGDSASRELTPEEKEQQRQACEALKNFDLGKSMASATKQVFSEAVNEAVSEKKAEVRQGAKNKIKGLIKKPRWP